MGSVNHELPSILLLSWLRTRYVTREGRIKVQINRLFEIVYILLDKKNITANELAAHFEVSKRTILRDIETLTI